MYVCVRAHVRVYQCARILFPFGLGGFTLKSRRPAHRDGAHPFRSPWGLAATTVARVSQRIRTAGSSGEATRRSIHS